ncbi:MAG: hypothetical protein ABI142_03155 [Bryocella sp.]
MASLATAQRPVAPKVELFGGYSYVYPNATLTGTLPGGIVPVTSCMCSIPRGAGAAITFDFNRWLGLTADWSGHWSPDSGIPSSEIGKANLFTYSGGPKFTYRTKHFAPFAEVLVGAHHLAPQLFTADTKFGVLAGGGLDWMPTKHFGVRLVQADYLISNHHFGSQATVANTDLRGVRLQAGLVFMFGGHAAAQPLPPPPPPVVAPVVVPPPPPPPAPLTMTCTANPSSVMAGDSSTITAVATSTRHVTYSYSTSDGTIAGTSDTATLMTPAGAAGTALVTCHAMDDLGQSASATAPVDFTVPIAPIVQTHALCTVSFARDTKRPVRVDNEGKACLDDVALSMQRDTSATLLLTAEDTQSLHSKHLASQRARNVKEYLVTDKGIESSRVSLYTAAGTEKAVTITLVPTGAKPDLETKTPLDSQEAR